MSQGSSVHHSTVEHYRAFDAALPHHASLLGHLGMAQDQLKEVRNALAEAKETLGGKRADLMQLWSRGQTVEEMIRILDQMYRQLIIIPEQFETNHSAVNISRQSRMYWKA
jgi:exocyst complex component 4